MRKAVFDFFQNGFSSVLRLFEDEIETKIFRTYRHPYSQIECVDTLSRNASRHLIFNWGDSRWIFHAMIIREDWLIEVMQFLQRKIALLPRAQMVAS